MMIYLVSNVFMCLKLFFRRKSPYRPWLLLLHLNALQTLAFFSSLLCAPVGAKNETNLHFNRIGPRMNLCVKTTFFFFCHIQCLPADNISHPLPLSQFEYLTTQQVSLWTLNKLNFQLAYYGNCFSFKILFWSWLNNFQWYQLSLIKEVIHICWIVIQYL